MYRLVLMSNKWMAVEVCPNWLSDHKEREEFEDFIMEGYQVAFIEDIDYFELKEGQSIQLVERD